MKLIKKLCTSAIASMLHPCRRKVGVTFEEFREALDGHIERCRCEKLEKSLGWKTIRQHREELGYAA